MEAVSFPVPAPPFSIGAEQWPGLAKLTEECGELLQVLGKIVGSGGGGEYADGTVYDVQSRLIEEMGDVTAAMRFFAEHNDLNLLAIRNRSTSKYHVFSRWRREEGRAVSGKEEG